MPKVLWTPIAESDLDDILFYIAYVDRNPRTGERIYREIPIVIRPTNGGWVDPLLSKRVYNQC